MLHMNSEGDGMTTRTCLRGLFISVAVLMISVIALPAGAQSERAVSFNIGGGFTPAVGALSQRLDNGWNFTGGAAYNIRPSFSLGAQFMYNGLGVSRSLLDAAGAPDGDANVWSITAQPRLELPFSSKLNPYLVGGIGYYRRTVHFTQPALAATTFFDPFFGVLFPGVISTNQVLGTITRSGIGGNLGGGFAFSLGHGGTEVFTEARYHYANTGHTPTRMIPVTIGIRF